MAKLAFVISVVALVVAILAYQRAGGLGGVEEQMQALRGAVESARQETADALSRMERALRPGEQPQKP